KTGGRRGVSPDRRFLHQADEANAFARQRLDQTLFLAGIADRASRNIQPRRQCRIGNGPPLPDGGNQIVLADDALAVADQEIEQIEHWGRDRDGFSAAMQLAAAGVESTVLEKIAQAASPCWPRRSKILLQRKVSRR